MPSSSLTYLCLANTHTYHQPPSHSVQLGCAGGLWNLKEERARVSLYCRNESSSSANISSFKRDLQHRDARRKMQYNSSSPSSPPQVLPPSHEALHPDHSTYYNNILSQLLPTVNGALQSKTTHTHTADNDMCNTVSTTQAHMRSCSMLHGRGRW